MSKYVQGTLAAILMAGMLAGCSSSSDKQPDKQPSASGTGPASGNTTAAADGMKDKLKITMMTTSYVGGGWPEKHPILDKINEKFNVDLQMLWVPSDNYVEKLNAIAASNDFPDAFTVNTDQFKKWRDKGIFLDVKPLLGSYPNLTKYISEADYKLLNPKDKYLGVPYYSIETRDALVIRKDWLDKLGLKVPTTLDELYETAKAFTQKDPDGNGQNDTVGLSLNITPSFDMQDIDYASYAFGLPNQWKNDGGKLVPSLGMAKEWKDFVGFLRKAYAEGVLDKDFAVNKNRDPLNKFEAGKLGISYINPNEFHSNTMATLLKTNPKAEVIQIEPPKGPTGIQGSKTFTSGSTKIAINAKIDKKKQERILKVLDYMLSDEGDLLTKNGIEGVHYKKEGDKYTKLDAFDKDRPSLLSMWLIRRNDPLIQVRKWDDQKKVAEISSFYKLNDKFPIRNPGAGLDSETDVKQGTNLKQKFMDGMVKIVAGKDPLDNVDKVVADWKSGGGDKITAEVNAEFAKLK
ncbi:extracellular solute-binding protein [Paenibacillus cremeus]|uniref:extracellular solute-binding protein n=1 Tax=Paenibacillus cremeus TaxID=2163881 RepID=UPI0016464FFF|nr:extracellular solute-binding protein [Paenibacillus cremeus]